jgi:hypothetical protein
MSQWSHFLIHRTGNDEGYRVYSDTEVRSSAQAAQRPTGRLLAGQLSGSNEVRQLEGLAQDKAFTDKASCKDAKRPQLEAYAISARAS